MNTQDEPTPPQAPRSDVQRDRPKRRLLIVEDEAVIRFVLRCEFEQRGFEVTEVENGRQALETFSVAPTSWTGAFVDLLLPDTHGDDLIERFLALRPGLPVVLMTGDADPDTERKARERQLTILRKPFPLERVRPLVAAMVEQAEAAEQGQREGQEPDPTPDQTPDQTPEQEPRS
jgi:DNA-binding NtrC family response regulator